MERIPASEVNEVNDNSNVYHIIKGEKIMAGLSAEQIAQLMAGRTRKGLYRDKLNEFINSGEGGVCVQDEWPVDFADKADTAIKQGFDSAKNSKNAIAGTENVLVINNDGKTFLVNPAAAGVASDSADETDTADVA